LSSKDKLPILREPLIELHDYDKEEDILNIRALGEALETTTQQHIVDVIQTAEEEEKHKQTDNESQDEQDPINTHIRNSPIHTSPTRVFGKE
jgi:hypothetical protein